MSKQKLLDEGNGDRPVDGARGMWSGQKGELTPTNLREAQLAVMARLAYVQKEHSAQLGFSINREQAVVAAVRPLMVEFGIVMFPIECKFHDVTEYVRGDGKRAEFMHGTRTFRFMHVPSGDFADVQVFTGAFDFSDKVMLKANTVAKKYGLLEFFCLETGNDESEVVLQRGEDNYDLYKRARQAILAADSSQAAQEKLEQCLATKRVEWSEEQKASLERAALNWQPKSQPTKPTRGDL